MAEEERESALRELADRAGILPEYVDQTGRERRETSDDTRVALLAAMGLDASDDAGARRELERLKAVERDQVLPVVAVHRGDAPLQIRARLPGDSGVRARWHVELVTEDGERQVLDGVGGVRNGTLVAGIPAPAPGYHHLRMHVESKGGASGAEQSLIVAPSAAPSAEALTGCERLFGLVVNLYTVRGSRDWGVGDFSLLGELCEWCGTLGGAFVGVNPLHALRNQGMDVSPYSPISRIFRSMLYLDVEAVPEMAESAEARALLERSDTREVLERVRGGDRIQYDRIAALKRDALSLLHRAFVLKHRGTQSERGRAYGKWVRDGSDRLREYATYMALDDHFGNEPGGWQRWPDAYRSPHSAEVGAFAESHQDAIDFHCWVQFEIDRQLAAAAARARSAGLSLGIYQDLAIGTADWGSDVWASSSQFAKGVSLGAPPDSYSATGQDWGLPPLDPHRLRDTGYGYWISLLRSAFAHAGALRIDHILGLFRQFWIPHGRSGKHGAYVRFPSEDLLGILALEASRHRALVVGEDLGTVPPEVEPALQRWGILSSRVLYFEREKNGEFRSAGNYPAAALTTANTHDLPTLEGFWTGRDIDLRREVGLIDSDAAGEAARKEREEERAALVRRLTSEGLLRRGETPDGARIRQAVHEFLARTPSAVVGISLDDVAGEADPVNVPGIAQDKYPSWTRRMGRTLDELRIDPEAERIARCEERAK
jgi:4-alpha-glucanotransferase